MAKAALAQERKATLDSLVNVSMNLLNHEMDFNSLFAHFGISYFCDYSFPDVAITTQQGERFLFNYPRLFRATRHYSTAHELGHLILRHHSDNIQAAEAEAEAEFFATTLTDVSKARYVALTLLETLVLYLVKKDFRRMIREEERRPSYYRDRMVDVARSSSPMKWQ